MRCLQEDLCITHSILGSSTFIEYINVLELRYDLALQKIEVLEEMYYIDEECLTLKFGALQNPKANSKYLKCSLCGGSRPYVRQFGTFFRISSRRASGVASSVNPV